MVCRDGKFHDLAGSFFLIINKSEFLLDNFVQHILQKRICFVHMPFGVMAKFLAQVTVDLIPHPLSPSFELFFSSLMYWLIIIIYSFKVFHISVS